MLSGFRLLRDGFAFLDGSAFRSANHFRFHRLFFPWWQYNNLLCRSSSSWPCGTVPLDARPCMQVAVQELLYRFPAWWADQPCRPPEIVRDESDCLGAHNECMASSPFAPQMALNRRPFDCLHGIRSSCDRHRVQCSAIPCGLEMVPTV